MQDNFTFWLGADAEEHHIIECDLVRDWSGPIDLQDEE